MKQGMRAALVGTAALVMTAGGAAPAYAKSDTQLNAPHSVRLGANFRVSASGHQDNGSRLRICVDQRRGHSWSTVRCTDAPRPYVAAGMWVDVRASHRGVIVLRARMQDLDSRGRVTHTYHRMPTVTVQVR